MKLTLGLFMIRRSLAVRQATMAKHVMIPWLRPTVHEIEYLARIDEARELLDDALAQATAALRVHKADERTRPAGNVHNLGVSKRQN
jgi:hypothetical protein